MPIGLPVALDELSEPARRAIGERRSTLIDYDVLEPGRRGVADKVTSHLAFDVPLYFGDRLVGLLATDDPGERREFTTRQRSLIEAIAAQAGAAIENARLFEAERQAQQQSARDLEATRLLLEAASKLNSWTSIDGLLNGLADVVLRATRHTRAYVALLAEDRSQATFVTTVGKDPSTGSDSDHLGPALFRVAGCPDRRAQEDRRLLQAPRSASRDRRLG